ncbi:MAG: serine hydrolase domain-containing protein [Dissulfurimicrobium sp.]|uniref:serine hydrolase domain-containing protein n=1 Tax=Dissulfurimicrobium sp. TaxID=2022436 RepID=UPI00404B2A78
MSRASCLIDEAIREGLFPGCALAIGGIVSLDAVFGRFTYAPWVSMVTTDTIYDLASLTKPLATALAVFALTGNGRLELDSTLDEIFPSVPKDKAHITIRMLLSHSSGLPAWRPYFEQLIKLPFSERKKALLGMIFSESLEMGSTQIYSDLGFMLLGLVVENLAAMRFDKAVSRLVFEPLGVRNLRFMNQMEGPNIVSLIPPTGYCELRQKMVCGEVNDQNAWALGGIAGHAGLFGTAGSVRDILVRLLAIYNGELSVPGFPRDLIREAFRPQTSCGTWGLGFDTPSVHGSTSGRFFSRNSAGHLGFTGVSFWMDLDHRIIVVFLSNRTFPYHTKAKQERMRQFRARLHDAIRTAII